MQLLNRILSLLLVSGAAQAAAAEVPNVPYVPAETPQGSGPYRANMRQEASLPTHTVYRPADLGAIGTAKLPIVAWGNGACVNVGNAARYYLTEIASHGFMVISIGPMGKPDAERPPSANRPPASTTPATPAAPATPPGPPVARVAASKASQLTDAINWAVAENARAGSPYYGKLDPAKVAVMGYSCGGLQATDAARDPRVSVLGIWNSGLFPDPQLARNMAAADAPKSLLPTLRVASIYVTGNATDQAFPNAEDDFERVTGPSVRLWHERSGHGGTYYDADGGAYAKVATAFLKWRLNGDREAAKQFTGPDCGLCRQSEWHLRTRNLD